VVAGDTVTVDASGATGTFNNKNIGTGKTVTIAGVTISGADAGNYTLTGGSSTTTADITAKALTASVTASNKTYDGTNAATISGCSLTGVIGAEVVTCSAGGPNTFSDKNVGTGKTAAAPRIAIG